MHNQKMVCDHCRRRTDSNEQLEAITVQYCHQTKTIHVCRDCQRNVPITEIMSWMFMIPEKQIKGLGYKQRQMYVIRKPHTREGVAA